MEKSFNKKQLSSLKQFIEFTSLRNKKLAINILEDVNWKVDQGLEIFYTNYAGQIEEEEESNDIKIDQEPAQSPPNGEVIGR